MIWAIGDLHLDNTKDKAMDIFGENWINHDKKIFDNWKQSVAENDIVFLPGDISWALKLSEAKEDLETLNMLPGIKFISKGNHDYWWSGISKMNSLNFKSLNFIYNNAYVIDNIGICGTRGWSAKDSSDFDKKDEKIFNRELMRLRNSIEALKNINSETITKIALLHYPPFDQNLQPNEFGEILDEENFDICLYGHLHGIGHEFIKEGKIGNVTYYCVSSDYLDFKLKKIEV